MPRPVTAGLFCFKHKGFPKRTAKSINKMDRMSRIKAGWTESDDVRWFKVFAEKTDQLVGFILVILYILFSRFWLFAVVSAAE